MVNSKGISSKLLSLGNNRFIHEISRLAVFGIGYFITLKFTFLFTVQQGGIAAIWPPSGVALAALILMQNRKRVLFVIFAVRAIVGITGGESVQMSLGAGLLSSFESALDIWLILQFIGPKITFERMKEVIALSGVAILSSGVFAILGATFFTGTSFFSAWLGWLVTNSLAKILITPVIVTWAIGTNVMNTLYSRRFVEGVVLIVTLLTLTWFILSYFSTIENSLFHSYIIFPFLIWAAFRFGPRGTTSVLLLFAVIVLWTTVHGIGIPGLAHYSLLNQVLSVQIFLFVMTLSGLTLVAVVNERKRVEDSLLDSEEKFKNLAENSPAGIAISTPDGVMIDVNPSMLKMFGYQSKEEFLNISAAGHYFESSERERFKNQIEKDDIRDFEAKFRRKDGSVFWGLITSDKQVLDDNSVQYLSVFQDVTSRKQAELELEESEKHYHALFESANDAIFLMDGDKFVDCNPKALEIFGCTREQIVGQPPARFSPEYQPDGKTSIAKSLEKTNAAIKGEPQFFEWRHCRDDGSLFDVEVSLTTMEVSNKKLVLAVSRDITDRKQKEAEIKKAYEQETALREQLVNADRLASLGKMASKIAHEINNPLTVIMGQAEIQLSITKDQSTKSALKHIVNKSKEVAELTRRYMDLGKPQDIKMTSIILSEVLARTVSSLNSLGILKNVKIEENYMNNEPHILGDDGMLEQVFRNLLINAIHASSDSASSEISVGTNIKKNKKAVTAYVSDKGVGIPKEDIDKIFEHYYTTKEDATGTGLGLPISKEITEVIHGGEISIESTPEKGTVFYVTIPLDKYALKKKKILLVDDEAYITDTFGEYLSSKGFQIRKAQNGMDALKIYSEFEPDLILSDFNMPEMDGIELFKAMRKIKPDQLFVMITGAFLTQDDLKILSDNKIPQIIKPAELESELLKTVKNQLEMISE